MGSSPVGRNTSRGDQILAEMLPRFTALPSFWIRHYLISLSSAERSATRLSMRQLTHFIGRRVLFDAISRRTH
jgi:hypothetical protein